MPEANDNLKNLPPQNIDAEQAVLGAVLIDQCVMTQAKIKPEDFYKDAHRDLWDCMRTLHSKGEQIDLITVQPLFKQSKHYNNVGGISYAAHLVSLVPTAANFKAHEKLVMQSAQLRRVINACRTAQEKAYSLQDPDETITACINSLNAVRMNSGEVQAVPYRDIVSESFRVIESNYDAAQSGKLTGITFGFKGIDSLTNGAQPGWFYVIAARPGKGKTSLAMQSARAAAKSGRKAGVVSIEMDMAQLGMREISSESGVPLQHITSGNIYENDWTPMANASGVLSGLPVWAVFSAFTAEALERSMNYLVQVHGVEIVFVDYLQLLSVENYKGTREQEVSQISRMHKRKAKELHIPVIALAQLNRAVENRPDKKPTLADLRDSGSIEQDADVVAFIYHEECKCPREVPCLCGNRYRAWYLQRKGRMNGTGDVELQWDGRTTSFRDM